MNNEFEMVRGFFIDKKWRFSAIPQIREIHDVKISENIIGKKTSKFTIYNYVERYFEVVKEENFQITLQDESLISYYYEFENGLITKYSLSFIPAPDIEILGNEDVIDSFHESLFTCYSDYIRLDFDETGYKPIIHETHHLHKGLFQKNTDTENEYPRYEIRFPCSSIIFPDDFLYFVLKYIYNIDEKYNYLFYEVGIKERRQLYKENERFFRIDYNF